MPKYYINDGNERCIIDSACDSPTLACVKALDIGMFTTAMVNGWYWVSERGHIPHMEDDTTSTRINSNEVMQIFMGLIEKRLGQDPENFKNNDDGG